MVEFLGMALVYCPGLTCIQLYGQHVCLMSYEPRREKTGFLHMRKQ